jgi:hypothetical protein
MSIDLEALRARNAARRQGHPTPISICLADIDELVQALDAARAEVRRLREENEDLHASAELWANLYASSVERANAATDHYHAALDAVAVLTEALEETIRECAQCGVDVAARLAEAARERFCERCVRAFDALRTTLDVG